MTALCEIPRCPTDISDETLQKVVGRDGLVIVECGAHDGRDTERFLRLWPACRVFSFEPDPRPIERHEPPGFLDRIGSDPRVTLVRAAVGSDCGPSLLHRSTGSPPGQPAVTDWDHSSSLRPPSGHLGHSPWCEFPKRLELFVPTVTLDSWMGTRPEIKTIDLLWVDVQGGQRGLIDGAHQTLTMTRYAYMECHRQPLYDGEPEQEEFLGMMDRLGFEPLAMYEGYNFLFRNRMVYHAKAQRPS